MFSFLCPFLSLKIPGSLPPIFWNFNPLFSRKSIVIITNGGEGESGISKHHLRPSFSDRKTTDILKHQL